jgi:hypothetical protein
VRKCVAALTSIQRYNIGSLDVADYIDLRLALYKVSVAAVWQRIRQLSHRVSIAYYHIQRNRKRVILAFSYTPSALFTRLLELTFDQILYSAQEFLVFEPLFEEDGHGFKHQPKLDDINWSAEV